MIDLADEFSAAVCSLTPDRITEFAAAGVNIAAINGLMVGATPIETHGSGLYGPSDEGSAAVLLPCGFHDGLNWHLDDIVAFRPDKPSRWWSRRGIATVLGEVNSFSIEPRRLHARPLDWVNDLGRGICVLDWGSDPVDLLMGAGPLAVNRQLENKLRTGAIKAAAARVRNICHG